MKHPEILWTSDELVLYQRRFLRFVKEYQMQYDIIACGCTDKYKSNDKTFCAVIYVNKETDLKTLNFLEHRFYDLMHTVGYAKIFLKVLNDRRSFALWNMTLECKLTYDKEAIDALQLEQQQSDVLSDRLPNSYTES